jgi:hypothetical protein
MEEIMKFSKKTAGIAASSLMAMSLFSLSAFADSRPQSATWRAGNDRYERRDNDRYERNGRDDRRDRSGRVATIAGVVERIDNRRDVIVLRDARSNRSIVIDMDRLDERRRNRADLTDLRRGDFIRLTGEWDRDGFEAHRIDDIRRHTRR